MTDLHALYFLIGGLTLAIILIYIGVTLEENIIILYLAAIIGLIAILYPIHIVEQNYCIQLYKQSLKGDIEAKVKYDLKINERRSCYVPVIIHR